MKTKHFVKSFFVTLIQVLISGIVAVFFMKGIETHNYFLCGCCLSVFSTLFWNDFMDCITTRIINSFSTNNIEEITIDTTGKDED